VKGCAGCLVWVLSFPLFALVLAWPLVISHSPAAWAVALVWWLILSGLAVLAARLRH